MDESKRLRSIDTATRKTALFRPENKTASLPKVASRDIFVDIIAFIKTAEVQLPRFKLGLAYKLNTRKELLKIISCRSNALNASIISMKNAFTFPVLYLRSKYFRLCLSTQCTTMKPF